MAFNYVSDAVLILHLNAAFCMIHAQISKKMYFHKYFEKNLTNTEKAWEGINNLLGQKNKVQKDTSSLKCPHTRQVCYNSSEFPDIINNFHNVVSAKSNLLNMLSWT